MVVERPRLRLRQLPVAIRVPFLEFGFEPGVEIGAREAAVAVDDERREARAIRVRILRREMAPAMTRMLTVAATEHGAALREKGDGENRNHDNTRHRFALPRCVRSKVAPRRRLDALRFRQE